MKDIAKKRLPVGPLKIHLTDLVQAAYQRGPELHFAFHKEALTILFQRNINPIVIKTKNETMELAFEELAILTKEDSATFKPKDKIFDLFSISFSAKAVNEAITENKISKEDVTVLRSGMFNKVTVTPWLKALLKQYFYETIMMMESAPGCTFFLEKQIINEIMRCIFTNYHTKDETLDMILDQKTHEAILFIEANLNQENLSITDIAREVGMSDSSLLRKFKSTTGTTPYNYIKRRRLENAWSLIKDKKVSVSEACFLVGYSDFASFSKTFKKTYGVLPSEVKNT